VGGAFGFSPGMYEKANGMLSMSEMTTSHQLIRIVFLEQLYRAFTILNNEPYHND
jgi:23S rRNA (pseudouridine1915-N3)-methyltransferase